MLHLTKGTTVTIKYTATELATLTLPRFLFTFVHRATKKKVSINLQNDSTAARFDMSEIVVNDHFANEVEGLWDYTIREKADGNDVTESGTICETGYMYLHPATDFAFTIYNAQDNQFEIYNAQ
jgi:hypothetical protein